MPVNLNSFRSPLLCDSYKNASWVNSHSTCRFLPSIPFPVCVCVCVCKCAFAWFFVLRLYQTSYARCVYLYASTWVCMSVGLSVCIFMYIYLCACVSLWIHVWCHPGGLCVCLCVCERESLCICIACMCSTFHTSQLLFWHAVTYFGITVTLMFHPNNCYLK
jgi:hypothetical protein